MQQFKQKRPGGKQDRKAHAQHMLPGDTLPPPRKTFTPKPWLPKTDAQKALKNAIAVYPITFTVGPFGVGKTFVPAAMAAEAFTAGVIERILITRPAVGADEEYGFFPGELEEKVAPWAAPVIEILEGRLGTGQVDYMLRTGQIEVAPLGLMRGRTFERCFVILDEAQNTTPKQMKLFLSRIGNDTKMVVDGDPDQKDIAGPSGLDDAVARFRHHQSFGYVEFGVDDIVRSGVAREVCLGYMDALPQRAPAFLSHAVPIAA